MTKKKKTGHDDSADLRKRAEEALQKSHEHYSQLANSITDIFFAFDKDLKYTYWNAASEKFLNISAEEAIGKSLYDVFPDTPQTRIAEKKYREVLKTGLSQVFVNEYKIGGKDYYFEISVYPSKDGISVFCKDITERKQMEERLKKGSQLLKDTGEMTMVGGWELDLSTKEVSWTEEVGRIHGVEPGYKPKLGEAMNFYAPESRPALEEALKKAAKTGKPYDLESLFIPLSSKDKIWVRSLGKAVYSGGKIVKLVGTFQNIDKYKRAEEARRRAEENFQRTLDDSPLGVRIVTAEGETLYANRAILDIYGYDSIEELRTTPVKNRYTPESYAEFQIRFDKRRQGEETPSEYEISIVKKNGEVRRLQVFRKEVLWNGKRQYQALYGDITERKRTEEALRESKEFAENLIASMLDGFSVLDGDGVQIDVNAAFCQMTGFSREELMGVGLPHPYWPPEAYEEIGKGFQKTLSGEFSDVELVFMRKNGERFPVIVSPSWVKDKQGNVVSYFATVKDITDRKRAEEEKHRLEERSRKIVEDIFQFIPEGVLVFSRKMELLRQNRAFRELVSGYAGRLGFAEDELENLIIDKIKAGLGDQNIKEIRIPRKHETGK